MPAMTATPPIAIPAIAPPESDVPPDPPDESSDVDVDVGLLPDPAVLEGDDSSGNSSPGLS